jgi:hypothetical protein
MDATTELQTHATSNDLPDELQPLTAQLVSVEHVAAHARNTVKNGLS